MINPVLTIGGLLTWFIGLTVNYQFLPIAFGLTLYWVIITLFTTPTILRGTLPPLDDIYIRAFCRCLKLKQLEDPDEHVIPAISSEATHLLFGLDSLWSLDTFLSKSIDINQSQPSIVEYIAQTPIERSKRTFSDDISDETKSKVHVDAKELISNYMQRIHTIPLAIQPNCYLLPVFSLDASIQTCVHFPLPVWNSVLTMTDLTIYFPAPRGAEFFFETNIVGVRQSPHNSNNNNNNTNNDLYLDIQTTISIDRNRLENLYAHEDEYDQDERDYITQLRQEDEETQGKALEQYSNQQKREQSLRKKRQFMMPQALVLVARVITTYTYSNIINNKKYNVTSQEQYPHNNNSFQTTLDTMMIDGKNNKTSTTTVHPQATIQTNSADGENYAKLLGNVHPRMLRGIVSNLFGFSNQENNQLDCSFATQIALQVYHAVINDNLNAGLSKSSLAKIFVSPSSSSSSSPAIDIDIQTSEITDENDVNTTTAPTPTTTTTTTTTTTNNTKFLYPYRCILQTVETLTAPSTIRCYIGSNTPSTQHIEHRGYTYSQHLQKRQKEKALKETQLIQIEKKNSDSSDQQNKEIDQNDNNNDQSLSQNQTISVEAFPQFSVQSTVTLSVVDNNQEIVWARGIILTSPQLDQ